MHLIGLILLLCMTRSEREGTKESLLGDVHSTSEREVLSTLTGRLMTLQWRMDETYRCCRFDRYFLPMHAIRWYRLCYWQ